MAQSKAIKLALGYLQNFDLATRAYRTDLSVGLIEELRKLAGEEDELRPIAPQLEELHKLTLDLDKDPQNPKILYQLMTKTTELENLLKDGLN